MYPASNPSAYDRAITVFSPDGRLFQVEYAREAVKRGTTALGLVYKDGILLGIDKKITSKLLVIESIEKIFEIDSHMATATSGLVADARRLVDMARVAAQEEMLTYSQPIDVEVLTKKLCDTKQAYTQFGGARPFGAALLIMGIDDSGKHLYETDPSGAYFGQTAAAIGAAKREVEAYFEKEYQEEMTFDDAIGLALTVIKKTTDNPMTKETVDISYINEKDKKVKKLDKSRLERYMSKVSGSSKEKKEEK
jgi:proteasome alpha subunit